MFGVDLSSFPVGTKWIFALEKFGTEGGYTISVCWINYLKVEPSVIGNLYNFDDQQRFSLEEFRNMFQGTYSSQQLNERAERFGVSRQGIAYALKRLKISYKPLNTQKQAKKLNKYLKLK